MSDARFASIKTDPRFRRPKKRQSKVVLDDRFKHLLGDDKEDRKKSSVKKTVAKVDKYGRTLSETQETDDLRRFYRLEGDNGKDETLPAIVDYARGAVLMESSDEEDGDVPPHVPSAEGSGSDSDESGFVSLDPEPKKRLKGDEEDAEIDLDENTIATLDAQVAEYARTVPEKNSIADAEKTTRLAVVNLDWDYVRAVHLYKIFSSLVSPTASLAPASISRTAENSTSSGNGTANVARGRILSVSVYPSEFGKKRLAREEKEGPPSFSKKSSSEEVNESTIVETGSEADYDEDALRKYQLERLRYYYAIVECDTVEAAAHVYNELEGTELERSANVFDLSFVPDGMTFDDEPRDEAAQLPSAPYRAIEFVTDALRHSKVKLTWDEDDPERNHVLRRQLTKKEIEEADFRAYIASSSSSESDSEVESDSRGELQKEKRGGRKTKESRSSKKADGDKLRKLLLGGNDDELPEGWGDAFDNKANRAKKGEGGGEDDDVDMEVTFTPGLTQAKNTEDENTLEKYQRKKRERRKKRKDGAKKGEDDEDDASTKNTKSSFDDQFFGAESESEHGEEPSNELRKKPTNPRKSTEPSKAELALLATFDNPHGEPAHFDMKAVLKEEKLGKHKKSKRKSKKHDEDDGPGETQDDFVININDDRFTAIHEDHQFAIDPTNPQFKKTKSMSALLNERSKRQKSKPATRDPVRSEGSTQQNGRSLQSLVESVKRKSTAADHGELGKRRKLGKNGMQTGKG